MYKTLAAAVILGLTVSAMAETNDCASPAPWQTTVPAGSTIALPAGSTTSANPNVSVSVSQQQCSPLYSSGLYTTAPAVDHSTATHSMTSAVEQVSPPVRHPALPYSRPLLIALATLLAATLVVRRMANRRRPRRRMSAIPQAVAVPIRR